MLAQAVMFYCFFCCFFAVGAEDGSAVGNQENLVLESDFLLGQELGFGENDYRIVGFERDSGQ